MPADPRPSLFHPIHPDQEALLCRVGWADGRMGGCVHRGEGLWEGGVCHTIPVPSHQRCTSSSVSNCPSDDTCCKDSHLFGAKYVLSRSLTCSIRVGQSTPILSDANAIRVSRLYEMRVAECIREGPNGIKSGKATMKQITTSMAGRVSRVGT